MSELGSDENWLELGHVFPKHSRKFLNILCIQRCYLSPSTNIMLTISLPICLFLSTWNWKVEMENKNRVESSASWSSSHRLCTFFASKFGSEMRKQRKSFWAAISSIKSQGFSIWFPFIFDTNGGDKSRKWNGEIKIGSQDNCLESCQTSVGTRPYPFESSL